MSACSTCGKPVDPLRAPAVRVSSGKVVPFCSKECAGQWESKPVRVPAKAQAKDDQPIIEIVHEPSSGVVASSSDARTGPVQPRLRSDVDGAIQIADTGHIDDYIAYDEPLHKSRTLLWVIAGVVVLVGGAAIAYSLGYLDGVLGKEDVTAVTQATPKVVAAEPDAAVVVAPAVDAAVAITPTVALERARSVLRTQLKSNSSRVQRVAASALARTGDEEARETLAHALANETNEITKIDIAYALARSGDRRGTDAILAALNKARATLDRRDPRLEVGTRLARLGDKRAIAVLESSLEITQNRLGVAETLAAFGERRVIKVLEQVRADDKSAPDEKARATIALGNAGKAEVAPALREMLPDARNNFFAAVALANLHDEAARPVLVKQLEIPSLRVQAARALRKLAPEAPVNELLPSLLGALESNKDTEQVQIAEAILLLTGPATWSERE